MFHTNWFRLLKRRSAGARLSPWRHWSSTPMPGCKGKDADSTAKTDDKKAGATTTIGFIYVGTKDDYGYNQAMADGAAAVKGMPGVTVVEQENVPETKACEQVMSTMIDQSDASMIFATSFGYFKPFVLEIAPQYPKGAFFTPADF